MPRRNPPPPPSITATDWDFSQFFSPDFLGLIDKLDGSGSKDSQTALIAIHGGLMYLAQRLSKVTPLPITISERDGFLTISGSVDLAEMKPVLVLPTVGHA